MVVDNPTQKHGLASRAVGAYFLVKNIFVAIVILIVLIVLFFFGVPWYVILIAGLILGLFYYMTIRSSLKAAKGEGPAPSV